MDFSDALEAGSSASSSTETYELLQQTVTGLERRVTQLTQQVNELQQLVAAQQAEHDRRLNWLERFVQRLRRALHDLLS